MMLSFLNNKTPDFPRGLRNNNPGNLRRTSIDWVGKIPFAQNPDKDFEQFQTLPHGIRAMMRDLITDYEKGLDTVTKLIREYAPAFENNTASYINTVVSYTGIGANQQINGLTKPVLIGLCKAIVLVENGSKYHHLVTQTEYEQAFNILGKPLPGVLKKKK